MNLFYRIMVAVYSVVGAFFSGLLMILPFSDKTVLLGLIEYAEINLYRSNKYDVMMFILGLLLLLLNIFILISGFRFGTVSRYFCVATENGVVKVSASSIENIAVGITRKSASVKEAKCTARFIREKVEIILRLTVYPDTHIPNLGRTLESHIKESIESMTGLELGNIEIGIESVSLPRTRGEE